MGLPQHLASTAMALMPPFTASGARQWLEAVRLAAASELDAEDAARLALQVRPSLQCHTSTYKRGVWPHCNSGLIH